MPIDTCARMLLRPRTGALRLWDGCSAQMHQAAETFVWGA